MAQDLHEQPDVEQTAERLLEYVTAAIGVSQASVVLVHRGGRLETAAATDDRLLDPTWVAKLRSVLSVSLRTPTTAVGALTMYDEAPNRFRDQDSATAQLYADHAAIAIARARTEASLWRAIEARKLIGQAQGILMERFGLTDDQAFAVLRRYSQDSNVKLRDVARKLINTRNLGENL